jgi:hypothetical protein
MKAHTTISDAFTPFLRGQGVGLGFTPAAQRSVKPMPSWVLAIVPKPDYKVDTLKEGTPDVERDTIPAIKNIIATTLQQTKKLADKLKGRNVEESTRNVWNFVAAHVKYVADSDDHEELRTPSQTIWSGKGDCDCMTILISSLLLNMAILHSLRIMKQHSKNDSWGHIYVIVPKNFPLPKGAGGGHITVDCVTHSYNHEPAHVEHKDFPMSLHSLKGLKALSGTDDNACNKKNSQSYKYYARTQQFIDQGKVITERFLLENKIPFSVVDDGNRYGFIVGKTFVPPVISQQQAAMLMLPEIQNPPVDVVPDPAPVSDTTKTICKCLLWIAGGAAVGYMLRGSKS